MRLNPEAAGEGTTMWIWLAGYLGAAALFYAWLYLTAKPDPYQGQHAVSEPEPVRPRDRETGTILTPSPR